MKEVEDVTPAVLQALNSVLAYFRNDHPLFKTIPLEPILLGRGEIAVYLTLPAGLEEGDSVHDGLYTILLDTILAVSAWTKLDVFMPLSTINLKTDFFAHTAPGAKVRAEAHCDGVVDEVAICQGRILTEDGTLVAHAAGTFMVGGSSSPQKGSRL